MDNTTIGDYSEASYNNQRVNDDIFLIISNENDEEEIRISQLPLVPAEARSYIASKLCKSSRQQQYGHNHHGHAILSDDDDNNKDDDDDDAEFWYKVYMASAATTSDSSISKSKGVSSNAALLEW